MFSEHDIYRRYEITDAAELVATQEERAGRRSYRERLDLDTALSVLLRAMTDVAIDHFLIAAHKLGVFDQNGAIKCRFLGGTCNRKCVNGSEDRMSYDVDLSVNTLEALAQLFAVLDGATEPPFTFRLRLGEKGRTYRAIVESDVFGLIKRTVRFKVDAHASEHFLPLATRPLLPMRAADLYECSTDIVLPTLSLPENIAGKFNRLLSRTPPTQRDVYDIGTFAAHLTDAALLIAMVVALNCHAGQEPVLSDAATSTFNGGLESHHLDAMVSQLSSAVEQKRYITFLPPRSLEETVDRLRDRYVNARPLVEQVQQHILGDQRLRALASRGEVADADIVAEVRRDLTGIVTAQPHLLDDPPVG